ncbi:hypothetical protein LBMAG56_20070 [Verrucomicrobiota bacterium]|nr:hypothetical protein LBMAG56_20070 [Verrucomicrobiota bacterium]
MTGAAAGAGGAAAVCVKAGAGASSAARQRVRSRVFMEGESGVDEEKVPRLKLKAQGKDQVSEVPIGRGVRWEQEEYRAWFGGLPHLRLGRVGGSAHATAGARI